MLINRIAAQLYTAEGPQVIEAALDAGKDATLAVSQSGRILAAAAQFARRPRASDFGAARSMWRGSPSAATCRGRTPSPTVPS